MLAAETKPLEPTRNTLRDPPFGSFQIIGFFVVCVEGCAQDAGERGRGGEGVYSGILLEKIVRIHRDYRKRNVSNSSLVKITVESSRIEKLIREAVGKFITERIWNPVSIGTFRFGKYVLRFIYFLVVCAFRSRWFILTMKKISRLRRSRDTSSSARRRYPAIFSNLSLFACVCACAREQ